MRTAQELFDTVVTHLRKQNAKSEFYYEDGRLPSCVYRTEAGLSCAVGCLMV